MDPQQELFTELLKKIKALGYDVYDGALPPEGTSYPFIYLADSQQLDMGLKNAVMGSVHQTVHVWHNSHRQRGTVSKMMLAIKIECRKIENTDNFVWMIAGMDQRILADDTTSQPLLHGVLDVEFRFS